MVKPKPARCGAWGRVRLPRVRDEIRRMVELEVISNTRWEDQRKVRQVLWYEILAGTQHRILDLIHDALNEAMDEEA
jgi:hypothetical protein